MRRIIKKCFPSTIPVLFGYIPLGFAFGVMLSAAGYNPLWAFVMSLTIFAGTGQFLCVALLAAGADIPQVILMTFLINFRHFFYGLSLIVKYHGTGGLRWYMMFGMTDETYAVMTSTKVPDGVEPKYYYFTVTLLDHIYWIAGGVLGASVGWLVDFNSTGIEFVMTALFAVLVVEQWKNNKIHLPALIGFIVPIVSLLVLGSEHFLIPALFVVSALLLLLRPKLDRGEAEP